MAPEFFRIRRNRDGWSWTGNAWSPDTGDAAIIRRQTTATDIVFEMTRRNASAHGYTAEALKLDFTGYVKEDRV